MFCAFYTLVNIYQYIHGHHYRNLRIGIHQRFLFQIFSNHYYSKSYSTSLDPFRYFSRFFFFYVYILYNYISIYFSHKLLTYFLRAPGDPARQILRTGSRWPLTKGRRRDPWRPVASRVNSGSYGPIFTVPILSMVLIYPLVN